MLLPTIKLSADITDGIAAQRLEKWTKITAGATRGGPQLVRVGDDIWLIATGGDGVVQAGRLDLNAKQVEPSTWVALTDPISTDAVSCVHVSDNKAERTLRCAVLANGGGVVTFDVDIGTSGVTATPGATVPTGSNGDKRPAIAYNAWNPSYYMGFGYTLETGPQKLMPIVWAGGDGIWLNNMNSEAGQGWHVYQVAGMSSAPSCSWNKCVYRTSAGAAGTFRLWTDLWGGTKFRTDISRTFINTPLPDTPVLAKATGTPAIATDGFYTDASTIVMTDTAGAVWFIKGDVKSGKQSWTDWSSLGGWNRPGSAPSCVIHATSLVCAIQAPDGSIYMRQVGSSSGL